MREFGTKDYEYWKEQIGKDPVVLVASEYQRQLPLQMQDCNRLTEAPMVCRRHFRLTFYPNKRQTHVECRPETKKTASPSFKERLIF